MSINNLDDNAAKIIEPLASPPSQRIKVLKEAKEKGIRVYGFISPVLPGMTDLEKIFKELSFVDYVYVELLNTKPSVIKSLMPLIKRNFPDKLKGFDYAIGHPDEYYNRIEKQVNELSKKYDVKVEAVIRHDKYMKEKWN
jgi:DNA repair photolyase